MSASQRLLVISSDPQLRERLYDALSRPNVVVSTAVSFQNGLEILQQGQPVHLIVFDAAADGDKRAALIARIRHHDERLPVVLLVPPGHEAVETATIRHVQACLPTTVDAQALSALVSRWVSPPRPVKTIQFPGPILLVDDEPELLKNLESFLHPRGCTVITAASGEEALAQVVRARPALVLLDIKMPGMDGVLTLKKMKALQPDLPVIVASAVEDQALMEQASSLGAYDYIVKPYNLTVLEALLHALKDRAKKAVGSSAG